MSILYKAKNTDIDKIHDGDNIMIDIEQEKREEAELEAKIEKATRDDLDFCLEALGFFELQTAVADLAINLSEYGYTFSFSELLDELKYR